ncbi:hypothetical protein EGT74_06590 [Chitinophaga lutea]|uniref:Uncharacterized protein n=1 Tax=Chitinophaga lutea TaxID=2488634 RepID=A0A3N4QNB7_9BACT|nr:hypothetical protein [Chitinophaga lutea]RPE13194.1 hypothetical protein EGT74_06590 [Chitinophaga lutea]
MKPAAKAYAVMSAAEKIRLLCDLFPCAAADMLTYISMAAKNAAACKSELPERMTAIPTRAHWLTIANDIRRIAAGKGTQQGKLQEIFSGYRISFACHYLRQFALWDACPVKVSLCIKMLFGS